MDDDFDENFEEKNELYTKIAELLNDSDLHEVYKLEILSICLAFSASYFEEDIDDELTSILKDQIKMMRGGDLLVQNSANDNNTNNNGR